jgi:hypothetical protein
MPEWKMWKRAKLAEDRTGGWRVEVDGQRIQVTSPEGIEKVEISDLLKVVFQRTPPSIFGVNSAFFLFREKQQPFCYIPSDAAGVHQFLDLLRLQKGYCRPQTFVARQEERTERITIFESER